MRARATTCDMTRIIRRLFFRSSAMGLAAAFFLDPRKGAARRAAARRHINTVAAKASQFAAARMPRAARYLHVPAA